MQEKALDRFIFDVDEHNFSSKVLDLSNTTPVLVDFWAEWCSPCLVLAPALEKAIHHLDGRYYLAKLEVDDNMRLAGRYKIRGFPTVILFSLGEEVARFSGAKSTHGVLEFIHRHMS